MRTTLMLVLTLGTALLLAACGGTTNTATGPQPTSTPDPKLQPLVEPSSTPTTESEPKSLFESAVLRYLVAETGVDEEQITLGARREQTWPNSALGCPEAGMMYLDVLTPGFLIESIVDGESMAVHTNADASQIVICDGDEMGGLDEESGALVEPLVATPVRSTPAAAGGEVAPGEDEMGNEGTTQPAGQSGTNSLADQVIRFVAAETGLSPSSLAIRTDEGVVWRDSALGCPEQGQMYMQVLTAGRRYVVDGPDESFFVHTDQSGARMVLCPSARAQSPAPGQGTDK